MEDNNSTLLLTPNALQLVSPSALLSVGSSPSLDLLSMDLLSPSLPPPATTSLTTTPSFLRPSVTAVASAVYGPSFATTSTTTSTIPTTIPPASNATRSRPNFEFAVPLPVIGRRPTFSNTTNSNNSSSNRSSSNGELDLPGVKRESVTAKTGRSGKRRTSPVRKSKRIPAVQHQEVVTATLVADASTLPVPRSPQIKSEPPTTHNINNNSTGTASSCRLSGQKSKDRVAAIANKKKKKKARLAPTTTMWEERENAKVRKREKKAQKELAKAETKRKRNIERLEKHFTTKLGLKPSNIEAVLAAAPTDPRYQRKINLINLSILPTGDTIPLTKPLQYPFDCISFDGKYMLSVLVVQLKRRDAPTLCRFVRVPTEDVDVLLGPMGLKDPRESFLSPSLGAAARRCYLKSTNGWTTWFVLVVHEGRTYRVSLDRFRPIRGGPGFVARPGLQYTEKEIEDMCVLAAKTHPSTSEYATKEFFSLVHSMGSHSNREVLPEFLEPLLRVTPTITNPSPTESVPHENWLLPPITQTFMPTFFTTSN